VTEAKPCLWAILDSNQTSKRSLFSWDRVLFRKKIGGCYCYPVSFEMVKPVDLLAYGTGTPFLVVCLISGIISFRLVLGCSRGKDSQQAALFVAFIMTSASLFSWSWFDTFHCPKENLSCFRPFTCRHSWMVRTRSTKSLWLYPISKVMVISHEHPPEIVLMVLSEESDAAPQSISQRSSRISQQAQFVGSAGLPRSQRRSWAWGLWKESHGSLFYSYSSYSSSIGSSA